MANANRNYAMPTVPREWADSRNTSFSVAIAIHAISDEGRSPEAIWEAPTPAEWDHVAMAVEEYVSHGYFAAEPAGEYAWGIETITVTP
jgi:hypothetical protein